MRQLLWNVEIPIQTITGGLGVQTFVVDQPDYFAAVDQALAEAAGAEARAHRRDALLLLDHAPTALPWSPLQSLL